MPTPPAIAPARRNCFAASEASWKRTSELADAASLALPLARTRQRAPAPMPRTPATVRASPMPSSYQRTTPLSSRRGARGDAAVGAGARRGSGAAVLVGAVVVGGGKGGAADDSDEGAGLARVASQRSMLACARFASSIGGFERKNSRYA